MKHRRRRVLHFVPAGAYIGKLVKQADKEGGLVAPAYHGTFIELLEHPASKSTNKHG